MLKELAREHQWTDETPVPPEVFPTLSKSVAGVSEDEMATLEAFYAWESEGRPQLSKEQQERQYFEALARIRRNRDD